MYLPEKAIERSDVGASVGRIHRYVQSTSRRGTQREELMLDLDEIARQGARKMLAQALEAEVEAYLDAAKDQRDEHGHALVVRNGRARCT